MYSVSAQMKSALYFNFEERNYPDIGITLSKVLVFGSLITFVSWAIISSCGLVFNPGWGLASGWEISLVGLAVGIAAGVGIGNSLNVWVKAGAIFGRRL
jgi:hypothetical protein